MNRVMNLRELRNAKGLTQDQLAREAHLSQAAISALENGQIPNPQIDTVEQLAEAIGCDLMTVIAAVRASVSAAA